MPHAERIGSRREVLWDEHLVDTAQTTAALTLHRPQAREVVLEHDAPWEGDGRELTSVETFGDSLDCTVAFEDGDAASLAGKPVVTVITMSDADIYSFKFNP